MTSRCCNLDYRQGPGLPEIELYPGLCRLELHLLPLRDPAHRHLCGRRVRQPMTMPMAMDDGIGAACKAIQAVEHVAEGMAVHPRAWDEHLPGPLHAALHLL